MTFLERIAPVLAFRTLPATILLVTIYVVLLTSVFVTDGLPGIPKDQKGLNLNQAYADLHKVC